MIRTETITETTPPLQPNLMLVQMNSEPHTWTCLDARMQMEMDTQMMEMHSILTPINGPTMMVMDILPMSMTLANQTHTAVSIILMKTQLNGQTLI